MGSNNNDENKNNKRKKSHKNRFYKKRKIEEKPISPKSDEPTNPLRKEESPIKPHIPQKKECNNPYCDHMEYAPGENVKHLEKNKQSINNISDLINLGKQFHCKKNRYYHGLDMQLMFNLVQPLSELNNLVGMNNVKESIVNQIIFYLQEFNKVDKCKKCLGCIYDKMCIDNKNKDMLHTVITGPPGVGKSRLGVILGKIYKAMGILSKGHVVFVKRSDLIGKYLGHTASLTQASIDKARGGVLFIDEAYSLGEKENRDSFAKECIDTLNQNLSERRDFICIIAGYKKSLKECFFNFNEGLDRRFPFRYNISGYTYLELHEIFKRMIYQIDWKLSYDNNWGNDFFKKNKNSFPRFGGDMETLLLNCKIYHGKRVIFLEKDKKKVISKEDLENGFKLFNKESKTVKTKYIII